MPFVNKPKCKMCRLYTHEHINRYWVKCDKQCKFYTNTFRYKVKREDFEHGAHTKRQQN